MKLAEILVAAIEAPEETVIGDLSPYLHSSPQFQEVLRGFLTISADVSHSMVVSATLGWVLDAILRFGLPDDVPASGDAAWGGRGR